MNNEKNRYINTIISKKGYTLVEVVLALAILGILAVSFLPAFHSAYLWIIDSGNRSEAIHEAQQLSESVIEEGIEIAPSETPEQIQFVFTDPDNGTNITVDLDGSYIDFEPIELFMPLTGAVQ